MKQTKENSKGRPKRKTKHKVLKFLLAVVAVLVVLVVLVVPVLVSSESGRQMILAKINDSVDGQVDFTNVSMRWLKGLKVTDFSFNDTAGQVSVRIKHIVVKPHYGSILLGSLSLGKTVIEQPKVEINLGDNRKNKGRNYRHQGPAEKNSQAIGLPVKKIDLVVNDGNLKVTDGHGKSVELSQINSRVNLRPPGRQTNFDIDMVVADENKEAKVRTTGRIRPRRRTSWSLKGTSGDLTVEIDDLDVDSLGPVLELAGVKVQARGLVSANVKSEIKNGRVEKLIAELECRDIDVTGGRLKTDRLKSDRVDAAIRLHRDKELINIDKLEVQSDWAEASVSGFVPTTFKSLGEFAKADSAYNLKGSVKCDLAAVLSQMPHTLGLKDRLKVTSGQLSGNIETSAEAGRKKILGEVTVTALAGAVEGKKIALSEPVAAEVEITSEGDKTRLQGHLDCEYNWSDVTAMAGSYLPEGLKLQGQRADTIDFFSEYPVGRTDELLGNLNTTAKLGFEQAEYMGLNFGQTEVDIQIRKGLLNIAPFSTAVNNGQFTFAGQADFNRKPILLETPAPMQIVKDIQIDDQTSRKLLMYLNPVFAGAVNVSGMADFNCERMAIPVSGGCPNDIEVVGTISIGRLRLEASDLLGRILSIAGTGFGRQDITIHPTRFVLREGFLRYDDMQMDIGDKAVNFKGVIGLDKSLDMTVTLPYTTSGVGRRISLPLKGTIDRPELELDLGELLEEQLRDQLQEKLQEALEQLFKK